MKKLAFVSAALIVLAITLCYNVWRAAQELVTTPPGLVDIGRAKLHEQLEQSKQREAQFEKQDWNSAPLLRDLIKAHEHRIEQLTGNSQAGEILAHDREAIDRLQKRIADLEAQQAAQSAEQQRAPEKTPQP